jgi:hypothetical protein
MSSANARMMRTGLARTTRRADPRAFLPCGSTPLRDRLGEEMRVQPVVVRNQSSGSAPLGGLDVCALEREHPRVDVGRSKPNHPLRESDRWKVAASARCLHDGDGDSEEIRDLHGGHELLPWYGLCW